MPKRKPSKKDADLKEFIKSGGRKGAEIDFNKILRQASKPKKNTKAKR